MTLSSVAVSRQKGRSRVSKWFYVINLNGRQSGQANNSASIVEPAKEKLRNSEILEKAQQEANRSAAISKELRV